MALAVERQTPTAKSLVIGGILDFEKAAIGPTVLDLARTLAFLIVDCKYKPPHQIIRYFINSGYCKRGNQPLPDMKLLTTLVGMFLCLDLYQFLLHNPYESLEENEHFVRTKKMIVSFPHLITIILPQLPPSS
jgi:Ser/Thr protein kinase RdoA (MazF antagonist)